MKPTTSIRKLLSSLQPGALTRSALRVRNLVFLGASSVLLSADTCSNGVDTVQSQVGDVVVRLGIDNDTMTGWAGFADSTYVYVYKTKPGQAYTSTMRDDELQSIGSVRMSWESTNSTVAMVDAPRATSQIPRVLFVGPGTAVLTGHVDDPRLTLNKDFAGTISISVTVTQRPVRLRLSPSGGTITVGQKITLTNTAKTASGAAAVSSDEFMRYKCVEDKLCADAPWIPSHFPENVVSYQSPPIGGIGTSVDVTGLKPGTVHLIASLVKDSAEIQKILVADTVEITVVAPVVPARVTVDPSAANVFVGGTKQISASVFDASNNLISTSVTWRTSDANLATVNGSGLVTVLSTGSGSPISNTVQIVAKAAEGVEAASALTIYKPVSNVLVEPNPMTMDIGTTHPFTATLRDNNNAPIPAAATTVTWSTGNSLIATVDASGLVSAKAAGTTTVIATTTEGIRGTADLTVNALAPSPVVRVVVSPANITLPLSAGACQFTAKAYDANGNEVVVSGFRWIVDASNVASVDQNGRALLKAAGTTAVRAFYGDAADAPGGAGQLTINP